MLTKLIDASRTFHNDEDGLEAVQVVMIVAIAAMVLVAMGKFGNDIIKWAKGVFTNDLQSGAKGITY
jgi:Flp pilus assembly pilin Flp